MYVLSYRVSVFMMESVTASDVYIYPRKAKFVIANIYLFMTQGDKFVRIFGYLSVCIRGIQHCKSSSYTPI